MRTQAQAAYLEGRFSESARLYGRLRSQRSLSTDIRKDAAYWEAMSLLESGNPRAARKRLQRLQRESRNPERQAKALSGMARALVLEQDYADAERLYHQLLQQYSTWIDQAEVLAALHGCARGRNDTVSANRYAEELQQRFPESPFLRQTVLPGSQAHTLLTVQVGVFSTLRMARALQTKLRRHSIETSVRRQVTDAGTRYIVQAGAFSSRRNAEVQRNRLLKLGYEAILKY